MRRSTYTAEGIETSAARWLVPHILRADVDHVARVLDTHPGELVSAILIQSLSTIRQKWNDSHGSSFQVRELETEKKPTEVPTIKSLLAGH